MNWGQLPPPHCCCRCCRCCCHLPTYLHPACLHPACLHPACLHPHRPLSLPSRSRWPQPVKCCQNSASQLASWAIIFMACHSGEALLTDKLEGSYQAFQHPLIGRSTLRSGLRFGEVSSMVFMEGRCTVQQEGFFLHTH